MKKLDQPNSGILTIRYSPESGHASENPPRFTWIAGNKENGPYTLEISKDSEFETDVLKYENIGHNFFAPPVAFSSGEYFWRYTITGGEYEKSKVRSFIVDENSFVNPIESESERFEKIEESHPRLWLSGERFKNFKKNVQADNSYCKFDRFFEKAAKRYIGKPLVSEPSRYPNDVRVMHIWRGNYLQCQEAFNHIKFLAIAGEILDNQDYINQAINSLLEIAKWDVNGSTKRSYHDECAFKVTATLGWGYDWLYNHMTEDQRKAVFEPLFIRTKEIMDHVFTHCKIDYSLYDSHAIRSISSVLIPCGIAMLGEDDGTVKKWLKYATEYINVIYTPWGGDDGGWCEGTFYWTTGMAFVIDALNILKNYSGIDLLKRPFFQKTAEFPMMCLPYDTIRASFGDQTNLGNTPTLKTAFNVRALAGITGNGEHQWYFDQVAKNETYDSTEFFDVGWWDFYFDEMLHLSNCGEIPAKTPNSGRRVKWFKDVGWVAIHKDIADPENHIYFLTKSSKYGSLSHSHGDQNAFYLHAFGDPLLVETGYYIGFNSSFHRKWRKKSHSKNVLLIDGQSQYFEMDKTLQLASNGEVKSVTETENYVHVVENATNAYKLNVPHLKDYTREIYFVDDKYFVLVDRVKLEKEAPVSFLLHSIYKPEAEGEFYNLVGEKASLECEFVHVSSGIESTNITDEFDGVDEAEKADKQKHWHYQMNTKPAKKHTIISCLYPTKKDEYSKIGKILDEQGMHIFFYFINGEKTFSLCVDKYK